MYYAHSLEDQPIEKWQPLKEHLENVAGLAAEFAKPFGGEKWAYLAGLWHDLGKASKAFQAYLRHENQINDAFTNFYKGRVDHSSYGGQHAFHNYKDAGKLLAYILAGHHTGLQNWMQDENHGLKNRLEKEVESIEIELQVKDIPELSFLKIDQNRIGFQLQFFVRMIFSCLVDADFLDTEKFLNPEQWEVRDLHSFIQESDHSSFNKKLNNLRDKAEKTNVNTVREEMLKNCLGAAEKKPGFFSLTVPTGGGKTLSSMAFALKHAFQYGKKRIIYVIPFTSIIEQNAKVFKKMLGEETVLEHHSNFEPNASDWKNKLATENWDAPVIVTTNVQFFDSFYARKTSKCRKLHNIANSVIVFDEVQAIPVEKLKPCLEVLKELVLNYNVSAVLCTATQPALNQSEEFQFGLTGVREIVSDVNHAFNILKRTSINFIGKRSEADIAEKMMEHDKSLCVVSTRKQARDIFNILDKDGSYHLSALMYPAHRTRVLSEVKACLKKKKHVCRVVSTQLIEAGVDVDFPVVFRALAGMDSIAQATGRCNREGKLKVGDVFVFEPESGIPSGYFRQTAQCAMQLFNQFQGRLLEPECIEAYFLNYFWRNQNRMDVLGIIEKCRSAQRGNIQFEELSKFQMIQSATIPVIIALEDDAVKLVDRLNYVEYPSQILRQLQKYSVQIYPTELDGINGYLETTNLGIKILNNSNIYSDHFGLMLDVLKNSQAQDFIV